MKKAFDHIGIITLEPQAGETWIAESKVWITNPRLHPNRIEYLRPLEMPIVPPDQRGLWKLWHWPHVAYRVENLQQALAAAGQGSQRGKEVVLGPFFPAPFLEVVFVYEHGVIIEYMQYTELDHWFGQPNPPDFRHEPLTE